MSTTYGTVGQFLFILLRKDTRRPRTITRFTAPEPQALADGSDSGLLRYISGSLRLRRIQCEGGLPGMPFLVTEQPIVLKTDELHVFPESLYVGTEFRGSRKVLQDDVFGTILESPTLI